MKSIAIKNYKILFQNKSNLAEAIKEKTLLDPVWMEPCNEKCGASCTEHYNVAEICERDTVIGRKLGSGQFGTVFKAEVKFDNNIV